MDVTLKKLVARLNGVCHAALESAAGACVNRGGREITVEDLLLQLLEGVDTDLSLLLASRGVDAGNLKSGLQHELEAAPRSEGARPVFSATLIQLLEQAWLYTSIELGQDKTRSGAIVAALRANAQWYGMTAYAACIGPLPADLSGESDRQLLRRSAEGQRMEAGQGAAQASEGSGMVERFTEDFTARARDEKVDPVLGRDREVRRVLDILGRRQKNNPILVGEAGVGKTAVVEGLAQRIVAQDVPPSLQDARVLALDVGALQAGAGLRGEFEKRLGGLIGEVRQESNPTVLFVDEAHALIGAGGDAGGSDAANLLKPALARGEVKVIAATTWAEYRRYFEKDAALARRFQPVEVDEPTVSQTVSILRGLRGRYEQGHGVYIRDDALEATASLAARYITGRKLPDKAVDVLDTACARVNIGLSATPPSLEAVESARRDLERERDGLARDLEHGVEQGHERLDAITSELAELNRRRQDLFDAWSVERQAVDALLQARRGASEQAEDGDYGATVDRANRDRDEAAPKGDVTSQRARVAEAAGDDPLIPHEVAPDVVSRVVADWTGVPVGRLVRDEAPVLLNLVELIGERVRGQDDALARIAEQLRASKTGLTDTDAPLGVFLLAGPSGVGKTETATAVAETLFGGRDALTTINMSEFQERQSVSRLIGSAPGYVGYGEGGVLTEAVRQKPYSVVLFDEIEKAHPEVLSLFYQLLDKGTLNDGEGRHIDFRNTALFMTSNLGAETITEKVSECERIDEDLLIDAAKGAVRTFVPAALLARMTLVPFRPIPTNVLSDIVRQKFARIAERLRARYGVGLDLDEQVVGHILERANTSEEGARNIEAIINRDIAPAMAQHLLGKPDTAKNASSCRIEVTRGIVTARLVDVA